jgi:hypothetical protein
MSEPVVNERLLRLADLLEQTSEGWDNMLTLLAEHLSDIDMSIVTQGRRVPVQMRLTAERIRAGDYS